MASSPLAIALLNVFLAVMIHASRDAQKGENATSRCSFPQGFFFGAASSAYQFEGAVADGGRKPSIWDIRTHNHTLRIDDNSNGDVTTDQYHRFKEDVLLLKSLGMDVYRFSISWSRFFPDDQVNKEGLNYYNSLINALLEQGIEPFVTLYHWDLPQALEDAFGGWESPRIVEKFTLYADACFGAFGDRVKYWTTFNEPYMFVNDYKQSYHTAHHIVLAHAKAVHVYRRKYKQKQGGKIGITVSFHWNQPFSNSLEDEEAAQRMTDFEVGWFLHPLVYGDYPPAMRKRIGKRLPKFSAEQVPLLINSSDYIGINYYTSNYVRHNATLPPGTFDGDLQVTLVDDRNGIPIGPESHGQYIVPLGIRMVLNTVKNNYGDPEIIITENGFYDMSVSTNTLEQSLYDPLRIIYIQGHLDNVLAAISEDGVKVRGYIAWALLDNWEWTSGFSKRYGLVFVDFNTLKRYPKASALWFKEFLNCSKSSIRSC